MIDRRRMRMTRLTNEQRNALRSLNDWDFDWGLHGLMIEASPGLSLKAHRAKRAITWLIEFAQERSGSQGK
jgi:hypothetical protein